MSIAIKIENLRKEYQLGTIGHGTLYRDLQSLWAKILNKEDPNSILGSNNFKLKKRFLALENINLEIKKGEVLGIIGNNGAGKSTLLKILSRITSPSKGSIKAKGRISSLLEVGTGFHLELTGRENIYLNGTINGMSRKEITRKLDEIVDFAGVETFLDTPVKRYSSGMHVRLGFSVAAHLEPDILVVDEVLAVGDQSFQKKAINKLEDVSKNDGRTVLFVSHNLKAIEKFCTKTLLLNSGKIEKIGNTNEVIQHYSESFNKINFDQTELLFERQKEKKIQILRLLILNDNFEKTNSLDRTKKFILSLDYILTFPSKDFKIIQSISTYGLENGVQHNTTVLQWSEQHYSKHKLNNEEVFKNPGTYNVNVTIPSYILNSGKYRYAVGIEYAGNWYDLIEGIVFELYDSGSSHTLKAGRSAGLIAMPLDWNEKKIS